MSVYLELWILLVDLKAENLHMYLNVSICNMLASVLACPQSNSGILKYKTKQRFFYKKVNVNH